MRIDTYKSPLHHQVLLSVIFWSRHIIGNKIGKKNVKKIIKYALKFIVPFVYIKMKKYRSPKKKITKIENTCNINEFYFIAKKRVGYDTITFAYIFLITILLT